MSRLVHWGIEQNTDPWLDIRRGKLTASNASSVLQPKRLEPSKSAKPLALKLVAESFGEYPPQHKNNYYQQRGHDMEDHARQWYSYSKGVTLKQCGFVEIVGMPFGCSPDALIMDGGEILSGVQIKCPGFAEHIHTIESGEIPGPYLLQCHAEMLACDADSWVYLSYHPRCKQQFVRVIERDGTTEKLWIAIHDFCDMMARLKTKYVLKI